MNCNCNRFTPVLSRRDLLRVSAAGFGQLALAGMLGQTAAAESGDARPNPLAPRPPLFAA